MRSIETEGDCLSRKSPSVRFADSSPRGGASVGKGGEGVA